VQRRRPTGRPQRLTLWLWIVAGLLAIVVADGLIGRYT
jgi:hypothetical protein